MRPIQNAIVVGRDQQRAPEPPQRAGGLEAFGVNLVAFGIQDLLEQCRPDRPERRPRTVGGSVEVGPLCGKQSTYGARVGGQRLTVETISGELQKLPPTWIQPFTVADGNDAARDPGPDERNNGSTAQAVY